MAETPELEAINPDYVGLDDDEAGEDADFVVSLKDLQFSEEGRAAITRSGSRLFPPGV